MNISDLFEKIKGWLFPSKTPPQTHSDILTFEEFCELTHEEKMALIRKKRAEHLRAYEEFCKITLEEMAAVNRDMAHRDTSKLPLISEFANKDIKSIREEWESKPLCNLGTPPRQFDFGAVIKRQLKIFESTRAYKDEDYEDDD